MIKRLAIFQIILLGGLGLIVALPKTPPMKMAALNTRLPNFLTLSAWRGGPPGEPTPEEKEILAKDTEFYRRDYRREVTMSEQQAMVPQRQQAGYYPGLVDMLNASIVLSGKDLTGSIHALERCLTAQGFNIPSASTMQIKLRTGQTLAVRRLLCERENPETKRVSRSIAYYWFVGCDSVTSNHIQRGIKDFTDRVLRGYDQRWAYITVTAYLDGGQVTEMTKDDKEPRPVRDDAGNVLFRRNLTETDADRLVDEFIFDLGPEIIRIDEIKGWPKE